MKEIKIITLDMLTQESVSVVTENKFEFNGNIFSSGEIHRKAYANSVNGRNELMHELQEPYLNSVLAMWGNTARIKEEV